MAKLAAELRTLPAQVLEHAFRYNAFGSWWTTLRWKGIAFRIVFDGKERQLRLEQAATATEAESWEALHSWPANDGEGAHAIREVVARLRAI